MIFFSIYFLRWFWIRFWRLVAKIHFFGLIHEDPIGSSSCSIRIRGVWSCGVCVVWRIPCYFLKLMVRDFDLHN